MSKAGTVLALVATALVSSLVAATPALADGPADSVGVVDRTQGLWYLRDARTTETTSFYFGDPNDFPIMGDWDCDGIDTPGLYRQTDGYVYLRNSNSQGIADVKFFFGNPGDIPLAGDFDSDGCDTVSIYRPSQARVFIINELGSNDGGLGAADFDFSFGNAGDNPFVADFDQSGTDTVGLHRESTGLVYYRNSLTTGIADNEFFFGNPVTRSSPVSGYRKATSGRTRSASSARPMAHSTSASRAPREAPTPGLCTATGTCCPSLVTSVASLAGMIHRHQRRSA